MEAPLKTSTSLRLATVIDVGTTLVTCRYLGRAGENPFDCPVPHPYVGRAGGIFIGIEKGTVVLVSEGPSEERFIIACVPIKQQFFDQEGVEDTLYNNTPYPEVIEGQLVLRASGNGSYIGIHPDGDISLDAGAGDDGADFELSGDSRALFVRVDNKYSFTEAGRSIEGVVRRDKNTKEEVLDTETFDFLTGEGYDKLLKPIGRLPQYETSHDTLKFERNFIRNPALIEKRNIVYEYADSFVLGKLTNESKAMIDIQHGEQVDRNIGARSNRRTDILNLNMLNYNHLIEKVEGTLVDIYGNVLNINRGVIGFPDLKSLGLSDDQGATQTAVQTMYDYMRRSIKYHFEINSRKNIDDDEPARGKNTIQNREHSRWSIDIDGEGLTKLNIPASSNVGNIPVLSRYFTSRNENDKESGSFKSKDRKDIKISSFSNKGPTIVDTSYVPDTIDESTVTAGTAYHDLFQVAESIFSSGKNKTPSNRLSAKINNKIGDSDANAGGRSLHANLDGSAVISIGADNIDSKSLLLDLEGGVVSHYGTDNDGRSIIHQSDGTVLMQIGSQNTPGRLELHLVNGSNAQKIIIDERGMTIDVQGSMVLNASENIGINAGAEMMIAGAHVTVHGSVDASPEGERLVNAGSTTIVPTGLPHLGMFG